MLTMLGTARPLHILLGAVVAVSMGAASASAAPAPDELVVSDAARPAPAVTTPPPSVTVRSSGSCAEPFTVTEANGGTPACSPSPWPAVGSDPWSPILAVVPGNVLTLQLGDPASRVQVSSTSNIPRHAQDPQPWPGPETPNTSLIDPSDASPTADPTAWEVVLPADYRTPYWGPATFSVVTTGTGSPATTRDFALSLTTTQWEDAGHDLTCRREPTDPTLIGCFIAGSAPPPGPVSSDAPTPRAETPPPEASTTPASAVRVGGRARVVDGKARVAVSLPGPGRVTVALARRGHRIGRTVARVRRAGRSVVPVTLRRIYARADATVRYGSTVTRAALRLSSPR
jgi:hypothetical protein